MRFGWCNMFAVEYVPSGKPGGCAKANDHKGSEKVAGFASGSRDFTEVVASSSSSDLFNSHDINYPQYDSLLRK